MPCLLEVAHHCEKFLRIFLLTLLFVSVLHSLFSMTGSEVELVSNSITSKETSVAVPVNKKEEKPTSLTTLFFRFSSTKERVILFLGFFFAVFITERGGLAAEPLQQLNCQHRTECQSHYSTDHANRQRRN